MPKAGYCLLVLIACSPLARGQVVGTTQPDLGANAALWYWQAFDFLPKDDSSLKILQNWDTVPLDSKVDDLLVSTHTPLNYLHGGAQIADCDWGLDFSQGPNLLLPYLNHTRLLTQLACLSARMELQEGDFTTGVDHLCDVLAMARHVGGNRILICHVVQCSLERDAINLLASHLKGLDKPAMDELTSRLASLPAVPPLADSMKLERGESDWLIARIQSVPDDKLSDAFQPLVGIKMAPEVNQAISDAGGTRAGVVAALQNLQPYYDQLDELLRQNPSQSDFHTKSDDLRHSFADKPFARILLVNLGGAFDTDAAEQTQMVMLKAAITVVQNGPDKIKDVTDPINHDPLTYAESADGFDLTSTVIWASHPLVLKVGN